MKASAPHFLLFSESSRKDPHGEWRFVLQSIDGTEQFEAADAEPEAKGERLELLAVVRGLEALPRPARVTLVTPSKYVNRGLAYGLKEWRANGWQWEHFGEMVPIKNRDLWQRIDRALAFHRLECRAWRFDLPHRMSGVPNEHFEQSENQPEDQPNSAPLVNRRPAMAGTSNSLAVERLSSVSQRRPSRGVPQRSLARRLRTRTRLFKRWTGEKAEAARLRLAQLGTQLLPLPWLE
jgi:ribonuclease HI